MEHGGALTVTLNNLVDILIGGNTAEKWEELNEKYKNNIKFIYGEEGGIYNAFKGYEFEELLGEYKDSQGTTEVTKRVITYIKK